MSEAEVYHVLTQTELDRKLSDARAEGRLQFSCANPDTYNCKYCYGKRRSECEKTKLETLQMIYDELRDFHDSCIKNAYELLDIDGSDGEFRYKWVTVAIANLKNERDKALADCKQIERKTAQDVGNMLLEEVDCGGRHVRLINHTVSYILEAIKKRYDK